MPPKKDLRFVIETYFRCHKSLILAPYTDLNVRFKEIKMNSEAEHRNFITKEIKYLQERLKEMGYNGDCAYERSIARLYVETIKKHQDFLRLN